MRIRTPVWMLHHVEPAPLEPQAVYPDSYLTPDELATILDLLVQGGYRTLTLAEAIEAWKRGRKRDKVPPRAVVLTFDDGCRCFRDHILPELEKRGMKATLFALAGSLAGGPEATNHWDRAAGERREELLDAGELRDLAERGVEIGCHGARHRRLSKCDPGELEEEVVASRKSLSRALDRPVRTFCYAYGDSSPAARALVEGAGYLAAVGIEDHPGARLDDPLAIPRTIIRPGESRFELGLKASGRYRLWKRLPRLGILRRLRGREAGRRAAE